MKNRVCVFILFYTPHIYVMSMAGAERRFVEIVRHWEKSGRKFFVVEPFPGLSSSLDVECDSYKVKAPFYFGHTLFNTFIQSIFWFFQALLIGCSVLSKEAYDIILIPLHSFSNTLPAYILSRLFHIPLAIIVHAPEEPEFSVSFGERFGAYRRRGFGYVEAFVWTLTTYVNLDLVRKAEGVLTVSRSSAQGIKRLGIEPRRIFVSSNGINIDYIKSLVEKEKIDKVFDASYLGRIAPEKGIMDLIKLWEIVVQKRSNSRLVCIGGGFANNVHATGKMVREHRLENNFILTGFLPDAEAFKKLSASKIFLFLSKGVAEGFGLAIGEAMACGLPVVAYDIEAVREVYSTKSVFLAPLNDIETVSKKTLKLLEDDKLRSKMGESARRYVRKFDWKNVAKTDYMFLSEIVSRFREGA